MDSSGSMSQGSSVTGGGGTDYSWEHVIGGEICKGEGRNREKSQ